jgi:hypothetical protein
VRVRVRVCVCLQAIETNPNDPSIAALQRQLEKEDTVSEVCPCVPLCGCVPVCVPVCVCQLWLTGSVGAGHRVSRR